jgi:hypothetical protein
VSAFGAAKAAAAARSALPSAAAASAVSDDALVGHGGRGADRSAPTAASGGGGTPDFGLLCMQLGRHVESETAKNMFGGDYGEAGRFLHALSEGQDTRWPAESPAQRQAYGVRHHLLQCLGEAERANALLRVLVRDGRLHPGLAPKLRGPVVGTDEVAFTPDDELRTMVDRGWIPPDTYR